MSGGSSRNTMRHPPAASSVLWGGSSATGNATRAGQELAQVPRPRRKFGGEAAIQDRADTRSRRISEEVVVGSSVVRSPDYNEAKDHSLIQVIEHVFKEDEDPSAGFPVTREKELKVKPATKLAIVTISGFEFWFGTQEQELLGASSRYGIHASLEADFARAALTVRARANSRFWGRVDREWTWRCHVVIQCFGER